jgi:hypothetical protein
MISNIYNQSTKYSINLPKIKFPAIISGKVSGWNGGERHFLKKNVATRYNLSYNIKNHDQYFYRS